MHLRSWQADSISAAMDNYCNGKKHFLCLASPGAGKTRMSSELAKDLLNQNLVDLVMCLSPSVIVASDFKEELEHVTNMRFDGRIGSSGQSLTYQGMLNLDQSFWDLFYSHRVFVIFDEIHHCAGSSFENANAWGAKILSHIHDKATFTLALTGTPWRSDSCPIVLSEYTNEDNAIECDYVYGLNNAISDNVCRTPEINVIDNDRIKITSDKTSDEYPSFEALLQNSGCNYPQLLNNDALLSYLFSTANKKLNQLRKRHPDSGGLIVAMNVSHAYQIQQLIKKTYGINPVVVTYQEDEPVTVIQRFKESKDPWIISVGMISEGTNIPRLRVCCHLTNVKTELYFRQILGRILRSTNPKINETGYLYMPAEPTLVDYAYRVSEDIPEQTVVKLDNRVPKARNRNSTAKVKPENNNSLEIELVEKQFKDHISITNSNYSHVLEQDYLAGLNISGRFKQQIVSI